MDIGNNDYLAHYGTKGQKWGIRRYQNEDGSLTDEGKRRYGNSVFISGTTKTYEEGSYKRDELPKKITDKIDEYRKNGRKILVGDAPGIDSQVQDYLAKNNYGNVEVFVSGDEVRKMAGEKLGWKVNNIDGENFEKYSKEWRAVKDKAMNAVASEGLAVVIKDGSGATRKNIDRFIQNGKAVMVYQLDDENFVDPILNQKEYEKMKHDDLIEKGSDFLAHHGTQGMKWGVRRYQNEDGSLTPEGRRRYGLNPKYSGMSDSELRDTINKRRTQNEYLGLMTEGSRKKQKEIKALVSTTFDAAKKGTDLYDATKWQAERNYADRQIAENNENLKNASNASNEAREKIINDATRNIQKHKNAKAALDARKKIADIALNKNVSNPVSDIVSKGLTGNELKEQTALAQRNIQEMDPDQLRKTVERLKLEKEFDEIVNPPKPSRVERGREVIQTIGSLLGVALTAITIAKVFKDWKKVQQSDDDGEYLAHYRTPGSKNGVRRYQNEDGSLTPEGYRHYGIDPNGRQVRLPNKDYNTDFGTLQSKLAMERDRLKFIKKQGEEERRQARYTQKFQQRQALREAKNQVRIQSVYDRQAIQIQREQRHAENQAKAENRANIRKNIIKGVAAVAVIGAALYTGKHFLDQRALDNQYVRDIGKINVENKAKLEQLKLQMEPVKYEKETQRIIGQKGLDVDKYKAKTEREKGQVEKYKAKTSRLENKALRENEGLNKEVKSLNKEKESLEKQAKSLKEGLTTKENQRQVLENKFAEVNGKLEKIEEERARRRESYKKGLETRKKNAEERKKLANDGYSFIQGYFKSTIKNKQGGK